MFPINKNYFYILIIQIGIETTSITFFHWRVIIILAIFYVKRYHPFDAMNLYGDRVAS